MTPLESLHRLSLSLGASLDRSRECAVFLDWMNAEARPRLAALFVAGSQRDSLRLVALSQSKKLPDAPLPLGFDPWDWLEAQNISLPQGERCAFPIVLEGELFGLLALVSAQKGEALKEEQRLLDLALAYLAPILRNIEKHENVERLVEERTAQLRESEERYRLISEIISDYAYAFSVAPDNTLQREWVAGGFERVTGYSPQELDERGGWASLIHPEDMPIALARARRLFAGQDDVSEFRIVRKDGEVRWLRDYGHPVWDETQGRVIRIVGFGMAQDINERKRAEEALRESEERYRAYLERASDYIFTLDPQGNFTFVNRAMCAALGYREKDLIGKPALTVVAPETHQEAAQVIQRIWNGETLEYMDLPVHTRSGKALLVQISGRAFYRDGTLVETLHIARDITLQKQAEEALKQREAQYRALFEQSHDAVFILDLQGRHIAANQRAAEILGYTLEELQHLSYRDLSAELENSERILTRLLAGERIPPYERLFRRKDGSAVPVEINVELVHDDQGNPLHIQSVTRDISARKQHERELEAESMLAQVLGQSLELQPLLERLLEAARHAIPAAEKGSVLLVEADGRLRIRALNGYTDPRLRAFAFASDSGYSARAARERRPILIADARADDSIRYDGEIEEARSIHGAIAAPLILRDEVIGVISLDSTRRAAFSENDLRLLANFAATAALIIERARLFEQTQRRAEETASLLEASLSLTTLDLQATLQTIGERAASLFAADGCRIFLLQPDGQTLRCVLALRENREAFQNLTIRLGEGVAGAVAVSGEAEIVNDMLNDPRGFQVPGTEEEPEAIMFAPLKERGKTLGVISIRRMGSQRPFHDSDLDLLKAFASMAASAVSNARLFEDIQQRLRELEILQTLSAALRQAHTVEEMIPLFIGNAAQAVNAAAGSIYLLDETSGDWVSRGWLTADGHWQAGAAQLRQPQGEGLTGWVGQKGEIHITSDWRTDPLSKPLPGELDFLSQLTTGLSLPLKAEKQVIGVMHVWYKERHEFSGGEQRLLTAIADMAGSAIQRARLHEETAQQVQRLTALRDIDRAIASSFDLNLIFNFLLNGVLTQLKVDAADILLFDPLTNTLYQAAKRGFRNMRLSKSHWRLDESLAGRAVLERAPVAIPDLALRGETLAATGALQEDFKAYYAYPLLVKGELKGVLEVFHRAPLFVTSTWMDFLETLAGQAAIAIDNVGLFENLETANADLMQAYDSTIEGWSRAMELRDKETEGHTLRVTDLTLKLAVAMGLNSGEIIHIRRGALLHDIGKIGVPDGILLKPGPLTDDEWAVMRQHPQFAYDMLSPIIYLRPALDIPYCHHEKWDGTGYPRGLKGTAIPLAARIFAVVDVWDALTSDRPYRPAWSKEKALDYIREQAGKHFDPEVVSAFLRLQSRSAE
jgi:PAS domain S-box-containing protein